ncbi:Uncharacterised protein [Acinetobacter baumannii]|nr:Uncharacterised protein [Acinetobacter baumannii]
MRELLLSGGLEGDKKTALEGCFRGVLDGISILVLNDYLAEGRRLG